MPFARAGRPGLLRTVARTASISGTAKVRASAGNGSPVRQQQESAVQDTAAGSAVAAAPQSAAVPAAPTPTFPASTGGRELADQLSRLADLRNSGLLTDVEFSAAKARLLM